jgi:hypothetical protein
MPVLNASRGLVTSSSEINRPEGALTVANDVVIDYDNTIQKRRGFKEYSATEFSSATKQTFTYKNRILAHYASKLSFDSTGTGSFNDFTGTFSELVQGLRIKAVEANGNFYLTTSNGIKKISAKTASDITTSSLSNAGGIKAFDLNGKIIPDSAGFLPPQSKVSYRLVYGTKDANSNLIIGVPSSRIILTNTSQDVKQSEIFTINFLTYSAIVDSDYLLFDIKDSAYFIWFNKTGSATAPINAATLSREGIEVNIQSASSNDECAAILANVLSSAVESIKVELTGPELQISVPNGGNVPDPGQGSLTVSEVAVTKIMDGSITTGTPATAQLTFTVPTEISTNYFYQLYRTAVTTVSPGLTLADIDPGDEQQFVLEAPITSADITAGEITVIDNTPEAFRSSGAYLYTNGFSGTGILSANERPPIATDIALFRNSTFYSNTKDVHRLNLSMLSVDNFVSGSTKLYISKNGTTSTYTFRGEVEVTDVVVAQKSLTVGNSYIVLNSPNDERSYYVWFDKGAISLNFDSTANVNNALDQITIASHSLATNDKVRFAGTLPTGLTAGVDYYVLRVDANTIQVAATPGGAAIAIAPVSGTGTILHTPSDPAVSAKLGIRVPLELYDDTVNDSKQAFMDSILTVIDFEAEDFSSNTVRITYTDSGTVSAPSLSSPAPGWTVTVVAPGDGEDAAVKDVLLSVSASIATSIDLTARSLVKVINKDTSCPVFAQYMSGPDDLPGKILFEAKNLEDVNFHIAISDASLSQEFTPELPSYTGTGTFPTTAPSDNNKAPNRIYYSKTSQPEAVPITNYIDVGSKDRQILRILALRDNLFVLKQDGIYIVTGATAPDFSVRLLDNSATLTAPDSAVVLNNLIYALTTQGIVTISETGVSIISRQIEDQIKKVTTFAYSFATTAFGMAYESDRAYFLWLPTTKTDTVATQCFRYNSITDAWTRWVKTNTCGIVNPGDDRMYLGSGTSRLFIEQERKDGTREDYSDRDFTRIINADAINGTSIALSSVIDIVAGDVITQEQYVTVPKLNRLLSKLDSDSALTDSDYRATLGAVVGVNLANTLSSLVTKLNADPNLYDFTVPSGVNTKDALKNDYNTLITELNNVASGTSFKSYKHVTDLNVYEVLVKSSNINTNTVEVNFVPWLTQGEVRVYKSYECEVEWAPQHFGSPEKLKQVSEGTLIFDQGTIYGGTVGYSSDRSADFTEIDFEMSGPGFWGSFPWLSTVFGGSSNEVPLRTLVPANKSRCRYLHVKFKHKNAREQFKLLGISLEPREVSTRGYR